MTTTELTIKGMSCHHCVMAVDKALKGLDGVQDAKVEIGKAVVTFDPGKVNLGQMKEAIADEGYEVEGA